MKNKMLDFAFTLGISITSFLAIFLFFVKSMMSEAQAGMAGYILFSIVLCVVETAIISFLKRKWILIAIVVPIAGILAVIFRYEIFGGIANVINDAIQSISVYFDAEMLFFDPTGKWYLCANYRAGMYFLITLLVTIYTYSVYSGIGVRALFLFQLALTIIPVLIELKIMPVGMILMVGSLLTLLATGARRKIYTHKRKLTTGLLAVVYAGAFLAMLIVKPEKYEKYEFFDDIRYKIEDLIEGTRITGENWGLDKIGKSSLGDFDKLEFKNEPVLQVDTYREYVGVYYMPMFFGKDYENNTWYPNDEEYIIADDVAGYDITVYNYLTYIDYMLNRQGFPSRYQRGYKYICYDAYSTGCLAAPKFVVAEKTGETKRALYHNKYFTMLLPPTESMIEEIEKEVKQGNAGVKDYVSYYENYVYQEYLDVTTPMAGELKKQWGGKSISNYADRRQVAKEIADYLQKNCKYTLSPGATPNNRDFVENFLKRKKEGYCTYFASAAVMMLRSAGIPARYVEGLAFSPMEANCISRDVDGTAVMEVCDNSAHAWVQYYVENVGWVDFDPTPPQSTSTSGTKPEEKTTTPNETTKQPATTEQKTQPPEKKPSVKPTETSAQGSGPKVGCVMKIESRALKVVINVFFGIVGLTLVLVILFVIHKIMEIKREKGYNILRNKDNKACVLLDYKKLERALRLLGQKISETQTFSEFCESMEGSDLMEEFLSLCDEASYSEQLSTEKADRAHELCAKLCDEVYAEFGFFKKIWYRLIYR